MHYIIYLYLTIWTAFNINAPKTNIHQHDSYSPSVYFPSLFLVFALSFFYSSEEIRVVIINEGLFGEQVEYYDSIFILFLSAVFLLFLFEFACASFICAPTEKM